MFSCIRYSKREDATKELSTAVEVTYNFVIVYFIVLLFSLLPLFKLHDKSFVPLLNLILISVFPSGTGWRQGGD
jgi:hypothetical protein